MRHLFEIFPEPPVERPADHVDDLVPPDDEDLIRPAVEEELFRVGEHGTLAGRADAPLAKHLLWTFGPWHRALPFLLQLRVELDGDKVVTADPEIGWLHQGLEKACEGARWERGFELIERVNAVRPEPYLVAWSVVVERLCGVADAVPRRAVLWRTALVEAARVLDHARVAERTVLRLAPRPQAGALREAAAALARAVDALRADGDPFRAFGGLARPVDDAARAALAAAARSCGDAARALSDLVVGRPEIVEALAGRGAASRRVALDHGFGGPALRATGIPDDLRVHEPLLGWSEHEPRVVVHEGGDALARVYVRLEEIVASADLLGGLLHAIGGAPPEHRVALPLVDGVVRPPAGLQTVSLEAPNGELSLLVVADGGPSPARVRVRAPSFPLAAALPVLLVGARLDDVVPVLESLGLVGGEIDR